MIEVTKQAVYESDGSDGYSPGTWGCIVVAELSGQRGTAASSDGGFASRELAKARLKELCDAALGW